MKTADDEGIVGIIRRALNFVDPRLMRHGSRVAAMMYQLLVTQGRYGERQTAELCLLAMLHDVGAYKTEEIDRMVQFETQDVWDHSIYGYLFIKYFSPLAGWAEVILFHHMPWRELERIEGVSHEIKELAQMVHLIDRADIFFQDTQETADNLVKRLRSADDGLFMPEIVALLLKTKAREPSFGREDGEFLPILCEYEMTPEDKTAYLKMIVFAIDFRSRYTVTHTLVTTVLSREVAKRLLLPEKEWSAIAFGAMLHDLGKIGIPIEILEYPGPLSPEKMAIMKTHVDLTEAIIGETVAEPVRNIALRHHEKLDGSGYPKGLCGAEMNRAERIVAVADIVSALNGKRSYKEAFSKDETICMIRGMSSQGLLDSAVVDIIAAEFDEIMAIVSELCEPVVEIYQKISEEYVRLKESYFNGGTVSGQFSKDEKFLR